MLINILIRKSRPELFEKLIASIDYPVNVIVHDDTLPRERTPYDWNLFCNALKEQVTEGYFGFADDDDVFVPGSLAKLEQLLKDQPDGLIVQFLRKKTGLQGWGIKKPTDAMIKQRILKKGVCGGGCLILAAKHKNISHWKAKEAADWDWINEVHQKVNLKFVPLVLQVAPNGGNHGK